MKYKKFTPLGCKDIEIGVFEFVAKTQIPCQNNYMNNHVYFKQFCQGYRLSRKENVIVCRKKNILKSSLYTRLLERFVPIFYLNSEHCLLVYILKQKKEFCGFSKFSLVYKNKNFYKVYKFFLLLIIHKPSLGSRDVLHKILAQSDHPF